MKNVAAILMKMSHDSCTVLDSTGILTILALMTVEYLPICL